MRGFVSVALCAELVESSGRVVRRERGRGWLKRSVLACGGLILEKTLRIAEGAFDKGGGVGF